MAKDDYDVIVYRVLVYLYACLKRRIVFADDTFRAAVQKNVESNEYFVSILHMMQEETLIRGLVFTHAWGNEYVLASDLHDAEITPEGIHYLAENSQMQKIKDTLKDSADIVAQLANLL